MTFALRISLFLENKDAIKAEKELMEIFPKEISTEISIEISALKKQICRTQPKISKLLINSIYLLKNRIKITNSITIKFWK